MLFQTPELGEAEQSVLAQVDDLKQTLRHRLYEPRRWSGSLRRVQFALAVQGSNSIEGYNASLDDAAAIDLGEAPLDASEETRLAIKGYRDAMTYVLQLADATDFEYSGQLLKSLQFMMTSYDLGKSPGLWRPGVIFVRDERSGDIVYEGADADEVPSLMNELATQLNSASHAPAMVRAAMAHLNLVMVHPFRDGNGRMARCLQTLMLAREGILSPVFCSIEEYLGANTQAYYNVLRVVGQGVWRPDLDARVWVRFCLTAHLRQARTTLQRVKESERLWGELEELTGRLKLHERTMVALFDAAIGFRVRNATYRAAHGDEITEGVASRDLKALVDANLLDPHGEKRGRYYVGSSLVLDLRQAIVDARDPRDDADPFAGLPSLS